MPGIDPRIAKGLEQLATARDNAEVANNPELAEAISADIGSIIARKLISGPGADSAEE